MGEGLRVDEEARRGSYLSAMFRPRCNDDNDYVRGLDETR